VEESRGLDAHSRLVNRLFGANDHQSAKLVDRICAEEVSHVEKGVKWFNHLCEREEKDPKAEFLRIIQEYNIYLSSPFNDKSRTKAGLQKDWYMSALQKGKK